MRGYGGSEFNAALAQFSCIALKLLLINMPFYCSVYILQGNTHSITHCVKETLIACLEMQDSSSWTVVAAKNPANAIIINIMSRLDLSRTCCYVICTAPLFLTVTTMDDSLLNIKSPPSTSLVSSESATATNISFSQAIADTANEEVSSNPL